MALIIIGLVLAILSTTIRKTNPQLAPAGNIMRWVGLIAVIAGIATSCLVQVQPGQVGVQTMFGKVQQGILTEGLNFINPMMRVVRFDARTQNYTMSAVHDEGDKQGDDAIRVLAADGLEVVIDVTVLFRLMPDRTPDILRTIGRNYTEVIVRPISRTQIRDKAVLYDAVSLYSTKREEFQQKVFTAMEADFKARGLLLEQVGIRNIQLPASVKLAIEAKINAEQESQKMRFVLDKERQEADRKRVEAQGIADYQRIITSTLTPGLLQYEQIKAQKELALSGNSKVVIMTGGKTAPVLIGQ
jgi:regulator of protease activity HflC (stomatin/prohibitin superfamily)